MHAYLVRLSRSLRSSALSLSTRAMFGIKQQYINKTYKRVRCVFSSLVANESRLGQNGHKYCCGTLHKCEHHNKKKQLKRAK